MIKTILNNKRIIWSFIIVMIVLSMTLIILTLLINKKPVLQEFKNEIYKIKYDSTWSLKVSKDADLALKHSTGSTLNISIITLDSNYRYSDINELVGEIQYSVENQNPNYKLISSEETSVTNKKYDGYQLLYENDNNQSMVVIGKKNEKILIANYVAENTYFDILLDSAKTIINNFELLDSNIVLNSAVKEIEVGTIEYSNSTNICDNKEKKNYEIFNNHYNVKYKIPKCFVMTEFDSKYGYYAIKNDDYSININTSVVYKNIYEYLTDNESFGTLAHEIDYIKNDKDYLDVQISNEKINADVQGYIYKISYTEKTLFDEIKKEEIYIVYSLDYLRTFIISIEAENIGVNKDLINNINVDDYIKYGENIDRNVVDGYLIDFLKVFISDYSNEDKTYYELEYLVPEKYKEIDNNANKYETRYFGLEYDEDTDKYKYQVSMYLSDFYSKESYIENIQNTYDYYAENSLSYVKDLTKNNMTFSYYIGSYSNKGSNISNKEVYLLKEMDSGGLYVVKITTNQETIPESIINDFMLISYKKIKYNND